MTNLLTAVYGAHGRPDYLLSQVFDFSNPRTRQARAHRLVNETPVLLWLTDRTGSPRIGNRTSFDFVGLSPDEEDLRAALVERMHPDDLAEIGDSIRLTIEDQAPFEFTARVRRFDGQFRWLHHRALPFYDAEGTFEGYAGASLDVTESEELTRELDDVRELFTNVTDAGPFVVLRTDPEGNIVYARGTVPAILDDTGDLVGLNWQSLMTGDQVEEIVARGQASVETREPFTVRVRGRQLDRRRVGRRRHRPLGRGALGRAAHRPRLRRRGHPRRVRGHAGRRVRRGGRRAGGPTSWPACSTPGPTS